MVSKKALWKKMKSKNPILSLIEQGRDEKLKTMMFGLNMMFSMCIDETIIEKFPNSLCGKGGNGKATFYRLSGLFQKKSLK